MLNELLVGLKEVVSVQEIKKVMSKGFDREQLLASNNDGFECIKYKKKLSNNDYYIVVVNYDKFNNEYIDEVGFVSFSINNRYYMRNRKFDSCKKLVDLIIESVEVLKTRLD